MNTTSTLLSFLFLLFLNLSSPSFASDSLNADFVECLSNQTNSQDKSSNIVYTQTDSSYNHLLRDYIRSSRYNKTSTPKPLIIVTPQDESHVQATVICAKKIGIQIRIRSGGHDYGGLSYVSNTPFLVLDMFNIKRINVSLQTQKAYVQAGATLGELYYKIWEKSKVHGFPAGVCMTLGVGGHFSGGGYGNMLRKFGLSIDNVFDAQIVDVNGRILDRNSMGEDLFWAIRGGGGSSFGVVLSYSINLVTVPETVTVFRVEKTLEENATVMVYKWQHVAPSIDNNLFMRVLLGTKKSKTKKGELTVRASIVAMYLGNASSLVTLLNKEFPELGLKKENCTETGWIESALWWANFDIGTPPNAALDRHLNAGGFSERKSDYVTSPIAKKDLESIWKKMIELEEVDLVFNPYGGRMAKIPASQTPFPHRKGNLFKVQYSVNWKEEGVEAEEKFVGLARELYSFMTPFVSKNPRRAFLNYRDLDVGVKPSCSNDYKAGRVYGIKFFNDNFDRLVKVKTAVDPENFFSNEQSIPTLPTKE